MKNVCMNVFGGSFISGGEELSGEVEVEEVVVVVFEVSDFLVVFFSVECEVCFELGESCEEELFRLIFGGLKDVVEDIHRLFVLSFDERFEVVLVGEESYWGGRWKVLLVRRLLLVLIVGERASATVGFSGGVEVGEIIYVRVGWVDGRREGIAERRYDWWVYDTSRGTFVFTTTGAAAPTAVDAWRLRTLFGRSIDTRQTEGVLWSRVVPSLRLRWMITVEVDSLHYLSVLLLFT